MYTGKTAVTNCLSLFALFVTLLAWVTAVSLITSHPFTHSGNQPQP
ncbi:MAG: hypothetical protein HC804_12250 [Anaerolineae bacterium]|nr:hypothetical protein [Anaerolineae bacterium]